MSNDDYNKGGFIAFIFSITFCILFFIYVAYLTPVIEIDQVKEIEVAKSQDTAKAKKAVDVTSVTNPWVYSDDMASHGKQVYKRSCAICHGANAKGDGAAGGGLPVKPRNFVEGKWTAGGKSTELFSSITKGLPGTTMAPFGALPVNDRWALVHFIRSITKNKPKDDAAKLEAFGKTAK